MRVCVCVWVKDIEVGVVRDPVVTLIMEYSSTPSVAMARKKWQTHTTRTKSYVQNSTQIIVIGFYEP